MLNNEENIYKETLVKIIFMKFENEMKKILGGLPIKKYCQPKWLADEENFSFQIV